METNKKTGLFFYRLGDSWDFAEDRAAGTRNYDWIVGTCDLAQTQAMAIAAMDDDDYADFVDVVPEDWKTIDILRHFHKMDDDWLPPYWYAIHRDDDGDASNGEHTYSASYDKVMDYVNDPENVASVFTIQRYYLSSSGDYELDDDEKWEFDVFDGELVEKSTCIAKKSFGFMNDFDGWVERLYLAPDGETIFLVNDSIDGKIAYEMGPDDIHEWLHEDAELIYYVDGDLLAEHGIDYDDEDDDDD